MYALYSGAIALCPNLAHPYPEWMGVVDELPSFAGEADAASTWEWMWVGGVKVIYNGRIYLGSWYFNWENWSVNSSNMVDLMRHELRHAVLGQDDPIDGACS